MSPGRYFFSLVDKKGYTWPLQLTMLSGGASASPVSDRLPITIIQPTNQRRQSSPMSYSTSRAERRSDNDPVEVNNLGPFSVEELERLSKNICLTSGDHSVRSLQRRVTPEKNKSPDDFRQRITKCMQVARGTPTATENKNRKAVFALDDLTDCRVPLVFKTALFRTCQPSTQYAISVFHTELFKSLPFGVISVHIFTKSHPSDLFTVFAFTLTPADVADPATKPVASLDRFEVEERLSADSRFWKYIDSCVPRKNQEAEDYVFCGSTNPECPVPQALRHSMNPYRDYPEGLQIAPFVYLYIERWPEELPMPKPSSNNSSMLHSGPTPNAVKAKTEDGNAPQSDEPQNPYYSVTLCVGKYIFQSVLGVHSRAIDFIINEWLKEVKPTRLESKKLKKST